MGKYSKSERWQRRKKYQSVKATVPGSLFGKHSRKTESGLWAIDSAKETKRRYKKKKGG